MFDRDSQLIFEAYINEAIFPKNFDRNALGSCMLAAEYAGKYFYSKRIKNFQIVEGWVSLHPNHRPEDWSKHTWIEFDNGRIFDPTKKQWVHWGFNPNEVKIMRVKKKYTLPEYLKLCEITPDIPLKEENENIIYACYNCEKEFGKVSGKNISHGLCKRHLIEAFKKLNKLEKVKEIETRPDESFLCPDLAKQQKEKLPNWAENLAGSTPDNYTGNQKINYM